MGKNNPAQHDFLTGETELLLTRQESEDVWQGLVHPGRKVRTGEVLVFGATSWRRKFWAGANLACAGRGCGRAREPLKKPSTDWATCPCRLTSSAMTNSSDRTTYQTVYAKVRGAVAAPTAGLHFTPQVLSALAARGVETCEITLHVGLGTFQPVRVKQIEDHRMEAERYEISEAAAAAINRALDEAPARYCRGHNKRPHPRNRGRQSKAGECSRPR